MNRRNFFRRLGILTTAFTVLPAATTYARTWKPVRVRGMWVLNPAYESAEYEIVMNGWAYVMIEPKDIGVGFHVYEWKGPPSLTKAIQSVSKSDSTIVLPREPVRMLENPETGSWTEVPLFASESQHSRGKRSVVRRLASSLPPW